LLDWGESKGYDFGILKAVIEQNIRHEKILGKNQKVRVNYLANIEV
jgi:hypothetical protein